MAGVKTGSRTGYALRQQAALFDLFDCCLSLFGVILFNMDEMFAVDKSKNIP